MGHYYDQPDFLKTIQDLKTRLQALESLGSVLQLTLPASLALAYGSGTVTFPATAPDSNTLTVTHGLGRTPIFVSAVGNFVGSGGLVTASVFFVCGTFTSTTFVARGSTPGTNEPLNATAGFNWIAIG